MSTSLKSPITNNLLFHQRHVTRQKILNWKQSLRFPARPRVSLEGVDLMKQLLCEPEDRLGSQATSSVSRPNSMIMQARRSGFVNAYTGHGSVDGAELIKVCELALYSSLFWCLLVLSHSLGFLTPEAICALQ